MAGHTPWSEIKHKRWRIAEQRGRDLSSSVDGEAYVFVIERGDERRELKVILARTALESENLPREVRQAITSHGKSAVDGVLHQDDPPRQITVASDGIREAPG